MSENVIDAKDGTCLFEVVSMTFLRYLKVCVCVRVCVCVCVCVCVWCSSAGSLVSQSYKQHDLGGMD